MSDKEVSSPQDGLPTIEDSCPDCGRAMISNDHDCREPAAKPGPPLNVNLRKREILAICNNFTPEAAIEFLAEALIKWELKDVEVKEQGFMSLELAEKLLAFLRQKGSHE